MGSIEIIKPLSTALSNAINKSQQHQENNSWEHQESNPELIVIVKYRMGCQCLWRRKFSCRYSKPFKQHLRHNLRHRCPGKEGHLAPELKRANNPKPSSPCIINPCCIFSTPTLEMKLLDYRYNGRCTLNETPPVIERFSDIRSNIEGCSKTNG